MTDRKAHKTRAEATTAIVLLVIVAIVIVSNLIGR